MKLLINVPDRTHEMCVTVMAPDETGAYGLHTQRFDTDDLTRCREAAYGAANKE